MTNFACLLCLSFCIVIVLESVMSSSLYREDNLYSSINAKSRYGSKRKYKKTRASVELGTCFIMGETAIQRLNDNTTVCQYKGINYQNSRKWIDIDSCRTCDCFAPHFIGCCQISLLPNNLPEGCIKDPAGRHSIVPRLGRCLAPLVEVTSLSSGRRPVACRNPRLHRSLSGKTWIPDRDDPRDLAIAVKSKRVNMKRDAVEVSDEEKLEFLYRIMMQSSNIKAIEQLVEKALTQA